MAARAAIVLLLLCTLALGLFGIERSLWLDEAWVANSVHAPTLGEMFYYPGWLQTSPPLFLLLERGAVRILGLSNATLREVPLALEMAAVGLFFLAARRTVSLPVAALATAFVAFDPVAIEYSRTAKQYSGEMAASAALLAVYAEPLLRKSFGWMLAITMAAMLLSYPAVFLIPALVLVLWLGGERRRAAWLAGAAGAMLLALYFLFIAPNYSPVLHEFWEASTERVWSAGFVIAVLICIGAVVGPVHSPWTAVCAVPCLGLALSAELGWYPASPRTRLFVLPCFVLLLAMLAERVLRPRWKWVQAAAWVVAAAIPLVAAWRQVHQHRNLPEEDFAGAVQFLTQHAAPSDLLLIHPSVKEGFEWYATMQHFRGPQPVYGATGWPCCVRGHLVPPHSSSHQAVIDDLEAKIPHGFSGRVWLMYSTRPTQWDYAGLDEGKLWRGQVWAMGCPPEEYHAFTNVALSPMFCTDRK